MEKLFDSADIFRTAGIESSSKQVLPRFHLLCRERPAAAARSAERRAIGLRRRPARRPASLLGSISADAIVATFREGLDAGEKRGDPEDDHDCGPQSRFHVPVVTESDRTATYQYKLIQVQHTPRARAGGRPGARRPRTTGPDRAARRADRAAAPPGTP